MRTHRIKLASQAIEARLLSLWRRGGWRRRLLLQRQMKPLVAAILLRMPRGNAIHLDAELQPPHRQRRQLACAHGGKRWPIVGPQRPRQPIRPKRAVEPRPHTRFVRRDDPTAEHESTARIDNRQRIAPRAIRRAKPAFEVRRPDIVRRLGRRQRLRQRHHVPRPAPRLTQPPPAEQIAQGARRRPDTFGGTCLEHRPQFLGPPVRMGPPQGDHRVAYRVGHCPAMHLGARATARPTHARDPPCTGQPTCNPSCG